MMYNCSLIFENYIHLHDGFSSKCLCRRITDLTSPYTDTTEKRCMDMAETSKNMAETSKKHDRELRRKEKKAAREARHNARNAA